MYRFCFDSSTEDVEELTTGTYQLFLHFPLVCSKICISNIVIPYSFYNITKKNNEVVINEVSYYIPEGNYNGMALADVLKSIFLKEDPSITGMVCKYNVINMKFQFSVESIADFKILFKNSNFLFGAQKDTTYQLNNQNNPVEMPYIANTQSINSILIRSNLQSNYIYGNNKTNVLFRLSVDKNPGTLLCYSSTNTDIATDVNNITNMRIQLTDENGHEIDLHGLPFRIEFICIP